MTSQNAATLRAGYEAWNRDDVPALLAIVDDGVEVRPILGANLQADVYRGRDGFARWMSEAKGDWDQFAVDPLELHEAGDRIVAILSIRARGRASGAEIEQRIGHLATFRRGKLRRLEGFSDPAEALRALADEATVE